MSNTDFQLFNFYVECGHPSAPSLMKVPLERALQQDLTVHFESVRSTLHARGSEYVAYDPGYRPEPGEIFRVRDFRLPTPFKTLGLSVPTLRTLDDATLESERVRALLGAGLGPADSGPILLFQAIDSRQVLRREGFAFLLSDRVFRRNDRAGLVIRDSLDASYEGGALYFSSEYIARRFLDLSHLFAEATNHELSQFFAQELFLVDDAEQLFALADQWMRRKIKMLQTEGAIERLNLPQLLEHAERFQVKLVVRRDRLVIPKQKKELKLLLRLLDEDFLESPLTQARYLANSKRRLAAKEASQARRSSPEESSQRQLRIPRAMGRVEAGKGE